MRTASHSSQGESPRALPPPFLLSTDAFSCSRRLVNTSISWVTSNGDVGCFVGHNAFIRWSALQEIAAWKEDQKRWQIWSESHVSEGKPILTAPCQPFGTDLHRPLQTLTAHCACLSPGTMFAGRHTRTAASRKAFRSLRMTRLTVGRVSPSIGFALLEEVLADGRRAEYAFGVSELLFHRLKDWPRKGPLTPMAKRKFACPSLSLAQSMFADAATRRFLLAIEPAPPLQVFLLGKPSSAPSGSLDPGS